jgi:hypothetical protein
VENTSHVRAELKKHQREAAIKATQMDAHVQCAVLAEIPATRLVVRQRLLTTLFNLFYRAAPSRSALGSFRELAKLAF